MSGTHEPNATQSFPFSVLYQGRSEAYMISTSLGVGSLVLQHTAWNNPEIPIIVDHDDNLEKLRDWIIRNPQGTIHLSGGQRLLQVTLCRVVPSLVLNRPESGGVSSVVPSHTRKLARKCRMTCATKILHLSSTAPFQPFALPLLFPPSFILYCAPCNNPRWIHSESHTLPVFVNRFSKRLIDRTAATHIHTPRTIAPFPPLVILSAV